MDKTSFTERSAEIRDLTPPKSSDASMIMNGAGNGMMLGAIPFAALNGYAEIAGKSVPRAAKMGSIFAAVVGCVVGASFGAKEARELRGYRKALREELSDLRKQNDANTLKLESWTDKEQARPTEPAEPSR